MPPNPPGMKKKKKGPAPAHQNKFAFKHNPKSKTTEKILSSPNIHVCRRCHDKIEWRKQYRKYKPRTQPGTCNECQKRNVLAAYHTICESCTRISIKAKALITAAMEKEETLPSAVEEVPDTVIQVPTSTQCPSKLRACAVCVKELALPDPQEDEEENELADHVGRIRLRERKAIERKLEQEARQARNAKRLARQKDHEGENADDDDDQKSNDEDPAASDVDSVQFSDDEDEEDDPFLKAVGGADKLLTGQAYQAKLLEQMQRNEQEP